MTTLGPSGTTPTLYFKMVGGNIRVSFDSNNYNTITHWPVTINNESTDPSNPVLRIIFVTDLTFTSAIQYFICETSRIQFGNQLVRDSGSCATITIDGVSNYPGLIQTPPDLDSISAFNLSIHSTNGSTLAENGGWIGQNGFAENGTNFLIVNCHSDGDISANGGGIIGANAFGINADTLNDRLPSLKIIGCSSSGEIISGGGIIGTHAGNLISGDLTQNYELSIIGCWSEGSISEINSGGIIGTNAGGGNPEKYISIRAENCYSTGLLSHGGSGGIFSMNSFKCVARNCYSLGDISQDDSGGIFAYDANYPTAENCYSTGDISSPGSGGIFGNTVYYETVEHCYTSGASSYIYNNNTSAVPPTCYSEEANGSSGWNTAHASTTLRYVFPDQHVFPDQQPVWIEIGTNQPFELFRLGYTPYIRGIFDSDAKKFVTNNQLTRNAGETTPPALIIEGREYSLVGDSHGMTINPDTGAITIPSDTPDNDYTLFVRYTGSYYYSTVSLIVGLGAPAPAPSCCPSSTELKGLEFAVRTNVKEGVLIRQGPSFGPLAYSDLMKIRKANAFVR